MLVPYGAVGALCALGGARPTGIGWLDAVLLGLGGMAAAACARRSRTVPLYVAAGAAALCQPAAAPLALGCLALALAFSRRFRQGNPLIATLAGGLTWAALVGAPFSPGATPVAIPLLALLWVVLSARSEGRRAFRRRLRRVVIVVGGAAVVGAGLGTLAVAAARAHVDRGANLIESGLRAARSGDTEAAVASLRAGRDALHRGDASLGALWARPSWLVPGVSQNTRALHTIVSEIEGLADVAIATADAADITNLRARSGQVDVAAVRAVRAPLTTVLTRLEATQTSLERVADGWVAPPIQDRLTHLRAQLDDAVPSAELALDGAKVAPALLGGDGPRSYLVLFTTPVEARGRTGFPGNWAEVTFTDGRFEMTHFGRLRELDAPVGGPPLTITGPADYVNRYGRFGVDWRNITMSPDFPSIAQVAAELYPQATGRQVDGVMSVDPVALAAFLNFTGPIRVSGAPVALDARNAALFLLRDQYLELSDNPARINVLEELAKATFDRLTAIDLPSPRSLGTTLGPVVEQGHLQVMTFGAHEESFLDRLGITGRLPAVVGDFLAVTSTNAAGSKIDVFARRTLGYDVRWDRATGRIDATVTITISNDAPASGLPDYVIGNGLARTPEEALPKGWNKSFITLYTPWDHTTVTLDGEPSGLERYDELGRHALGTFIDIGPGATRTLVVHLTGVLDAASYRLDLAAQPQVTPEVASVRVAVAGLGPLRTTGPVRARGARVSGEFELTRTTTITVSGR